MASRIPHFKKGAPSKHGAGGTENVQAEHFFMGSGGGGAVGFKGMTTKTSKKESSRITEEEKPKSKGGKMAGRTGIVKRKKKRPSIKEAARMEARFGAGVDEMQKSLGSAIKGKKRKKPVKGILEGQGYMDLYETPSKKAKKKRKKFTGVDESAV